VPISPELLSVTNRPNNGSITLAWSDEGFVRTGYRLYASSNGVDFELPINISANATNYTDTNTVLGQSKYYRLSVVGNGGESTPSRTYGAVSSTNATPLLLIDGNDRWQFQTTENPKTTNHSFAALMGQCITGVPFDTIHHSIAGAVPLTNYPAVAWMFGEESTQDDTFSAGEQSLVTSYLANKGNLLLSGSEVGWDLDRASGPTTFDRDFYHNQLRTVYASDDAGTYAFVATTNSIFAGNAAATFDNGTAGTYNVDFPDVLLTTNGSVSALTYSGGTGGTAAVVYNGSPGLGKLVNIAFPLESIVGLTNRQAYVADVMRFFGLVPPAKVKSQVDLALNKFTLSWNAVAGLKYRLQFKADLTQGNWTDISPDIFATNTVVTATNAMSATAKFYRVLLVN
jgi:hypothetical protein